MFYLSSCLELSAAVISCMRARMHTRVCTHTHTHTCTRPPAIPRTGIHSLLLSSLSLSGSPVSLLHQLARLCPHLSLYLVLVPSYL